MWRIEVTSEVATFEKALQNKSSLLFREIEVWQYNQLSFSYSFVLPQIFTLRTLCLLFKNKRQKDIWGTKMGHTQEIILQQTDHIFMRYYLGYINNINVA